MSAVVNVKTGGRWRRMASAPQCDVRACAVVHDGDRPVVVEAQVVIREDGWVVVNVRHGDERVVHYDVPPPPRTGCSGVDEWRGTVA